MDCEIAQATSNNTMKLLCILHTDILIWVPGLTGFWLQAQRAIFLRQQKRLADTEIAVADH